MANPLSNLSFFCIFTIFFFSSILYQVTAESDTDLVDNLSVNHNKQKKTKRTLKHKLSTFRFYWHDVYSGSNPTAVSITKPLANQTTGFGSVTMIDDALTLGPNSTSKEIGRAQGLYSGASLEKVSLIMLMNFVFSTGKYNGSTLTIMGSNSVFDKVREMPVIGGSGLFRFASGYALAQTYWYDPNTGDAIVQYDVSVMHFT